VSNVQKPSSAFPVPVSISIGRIVVTIQKESTLLLSLPLCVWGIVYLCTYNKYSTIYLLLLPQYHCTTATAGGIPVWPRPPQVACAAGWEIEVLARTEWKDPHSRILGSFPFSLCVCASSIFCCWPVLGHGML
jgi:hypothetical protein